MFNLKLVILIPGMYYRLLFREGRENAWNILNKFLNHVLLVNIPIETLSISNNVNLEFVPIYIGYTSTNEVTAFVLV